MLAPTVLHIDGDPVAREAVSGTLSREGYEVTSTSTGTEGLAAAKELKPDVIIMDVVLPDLSGVDVCAYLYKGVNIPLLVFSDRADEVDVVLALEMGADDYLSKACSQRELAARVKALIRRSEVTLRSAAQETTIEFPGIVIDVPTHTVTVDGKPVHLTPKEFSLVYHLASHPREVFTREGLGDAVWQRKLEGRIIRTVDTHVKRVRQKLEGDNYHPWSIASVWGVGYKWEVEP